jgi:hypothetical protein
MYRDYDPGYMMYLLVHSILPCLALVLVLIKNTSAMIWVLYCTYTVSKVMGALVGAIGPFVTGGAWWNFKCVEQVINSYEGVYQVE